MHNAVSTGLGVHWPITRQRKIDRHNLLGHEQSIYRVRHDVLLDKLQNINIRGNLHSWFSSYLSGRKQRVTVPGGTSSSLAVTSGIPQGSIIGPVAYYSFSTFMIYMLLSPLLLFPVLLMILNYLKRLITKRTQIYCKMT